MAKSTPAEYIPALGADWLTPFYDVVAWMARDRTTKRQLIAQARISDTCSVLDVGCGTGTLALMIKESQPGARVVGVDGDEKILEIARRKAAKAGADIKLDQGLASQLPYPSESFDRVVSTLMIHHLSHDAKKQAFGEILRVLRKGGELHVADFSEPHNALMRAASALFRMMAHSHGELTDNMEGRLPEMFREAGFTGVREEGARGTLFGTIAFFRAEKPR